MNQGAQCLKPSRLRKELALSATDDANRALVVPEFADIVEPRFGRHDYRREAGGEDGGEDEEDVGGVETHGRRDTPPAPRHRS